MVLDDVVFCNVLIVVSNSVFGIILFEIKCVVFLLIMCYVC